MYLGSCPLVGLGDVTGHVPRAILSGKDYVRYVDREIGIEYISLVF